MDDEYIPNRGKLNGDDRTGAALHRDRQTGGDSPRGTRDLKQNRWLASHEDQPDRDTEPPFDVPAMEFSFDGKTVRAVSVDGQNWFYANELCAVLQHSNPREAISSLDDDEKGVRIADTPGGKQKVNVVNEAGLYHLVLMSRMPRVSGDRTN
jgi:hypothetical protein